MPILQKYLAEFEEGCIYHVYNRKNNKELLFLSDENRRFFLQQYSKYLYPFLDTFCWSLLPNHFHLLARVKAVSAIKDFLNAKEFSDVTSVERKYLDRSNTLGELLEQAFKRFFQSYSLAFNKKHKRSGNLFYKPFKRVLVSKDSHLTQAIIYIHANPQKHNVIGDFREFKWSSWNSILSNAPTNLLRSEIIDWFGGRENFIKIHLEMTAYYYESTVSIEE